MRTLITDTINTFVKEHKLTNNSQTDWGEAIVGFADANHPFILDLKNIISPEHDLPKDVISDASIVISYFIPFTKKLANTNKHQKNAPNFILEDSYIASPEWALAYEETNAMLALINQHLIDKLTKLGYKAGVSPKASTFDPNQLISGWSQRHFAYASGLGTFGVNNMLINKTGCCGRYSSVVTNLDIEPDKIQTEENCLYKKDGSCGICVKNCPSEALTHNGFNRNKCFEICKTNAKIYNQFQGRSQVCGKCVVGTPCTFLKS